MRSRNKIFKFKGQKKARQNYFFFLFQRGPFLNFVGLIGLENIEKTGGGKKIGKKILNPFKKKKKKTKQKRGGK